MVTEKPVLRPVDSGELKIVFCHRSNWPAEDIVNTKTENGYANISTPELTAFDLVNYSDWLEGGYNRIAAVLEELTDELNPQKLAVTAERYGRIATIQRVGFLLDIILGQKELTLPLLRFLKGGNYFPVLLKPQKVKPGNRITGNPWKVIENIGIEMGEELSGQWE